MFKNLSPKALGITGRQSEILELALTYGFRGVELDIADFLKRVEYGGVDHAARFIKSAQLKVGGFDLPLRWRGDEAEFQADLEKLDGIAANVAVVEAKICYATALPVSESLPYHENFEMHRTRLGAMAERLGQKDIKLAVGFRAVKPEEKEGQYQFIQDAEALVTLVKSVNSPNVGLLLDTWNWHFGGGTLDLLRSVGQGVVAAVHLADAPAGTTRDELSDELRRLPSEGGPIDNVAYLTLLKEMEYRGPVTLVPHPQRSTGMTRDSIVQSCANALEDLWRAIGLSRPVARGAAAVEADQPAVEDDQQEQESSSPATSG
jgi:sugar phosphate isomerase/epimerase